MQKEIQVGEKKFIVRELLAIELDDINFEDKKGANKAQICLSTGLSEEAYQKLSVRERSAIMKVIVELNYPDFQTPVK